MLYTVNAFLDTDRVWALEVPALSSTNAKEESIPATGMAPYWSRVQQAAQDLIGAWTGEDPADISVDIHTPAKR